MITLFLEIKTSKQKCEFNWDYFIETENLWNLRKQYSYVKNKLT